MTPTNHQLLITNNTLLEVRGLCQQFGGLKAVQGVNLSVNKGEIVSIIGPNGAGKTTFFNVLTGFYPGTGGSISFKGNSIRGLKPHKVVDLGVARTFQNIRLFPNMTALENVMVARYCRSQNQIVATLMRLPSFHRQEGEIERKSKEYLSFVGLLSSGNLISKNLPYGDQRRLEIARALATEPDLLILDEPTAGMNHAESDALVLLIRKIREQGVTVLLIEHHMKVVMGISDRVMVLDHGEKIAEGVPKEVQCNERVIQAYLGKGD